MTKLTLNDGTELEGAYAIVVGDSLTAYIPGKTLAEGFALLSDPEVTKKIRAEQYGQEITISGYRRLFSLREEPGDMLSAGLKKK